MVRLSLPSHSASTLHGLGFQQGLVVDDVTSLRLVPKRVLAEMGLVIHEAADGWSALHKLRTFAVDVVITDVEMPFWSGLQLLSTIRNSNSRRLRKLPVIVTTSVADHRIVSKIRRFNDAYFMPKPIVVNQLRVLLRMIATSRWMQQFDRPAPWLRRNEPILQHTDR